MKVPSRKAASASEQRRHELQTDRVNSATVRQAFPQVGVIHIDLDFAERQGHSPSPQRHSLYPGAQAFFRFACPCADCDGDFDLKGAVSELAKGAVTAKRAAGRSAAGSSSCHGTRWRDSNHSELCRIELSFRLAIAFGPAGEAS